MAVKWTEDQRTAIDTTDRGLSFRRRLEAERPQF